MHVESIDIFIDKPLVHELKQILSKDKLHYDALNKHLEYYIVEYDSLLESRSIPFSDQCVMTIIVFVEDDKAHIDYWLTSPSGEQPDGDTTDSLINSYSIEYNGKLYCTNLIIQE